MVLESHVRYVDAIVDGLRCSPTARFGVDTLMRCLLLSRRLRDGSKLAETVEKACELLPSLVRDLALRTIHDGFLQVPSRASLQRFQLAFDVGVMLWRRKLATAADGPACRYGFADSSPQGGRDWLIVKTCIIQSSKIVEVMEVVFELANDAAVEAWRLQSDEPVLPDSELRRSDLFETIRDNMLTHTSPPVALGQGKSTVQDKAAALLYTLFLELGWSGLSAQMATFSSFTTDMGTELAIGNLATSNLCTLLPRYVRANRMSIGDGGADDADCVPTLPWFFQTAIPVAGVLHVVSNATKDLNKALLSWTKFYNDLKAVEKLICSPMRTRRLIATCIRKTDFENMVPLFECRCNGLYEKRWGEVLQFCVRLDERLPTLVATWNEDMFAAGRDEDEEQEPADEEDGDNEGEGHAAAAAFQPKEISRVLRSATFRAYLKMVMLLDYAVAELSAYAERCPCHEHVQSNFKWDYIPVHIRRAEFGTSDGPQSSHMCCPMRGRRAAEFASGAVFDFLNRAWADALGELAASCRAFLSNAEWSDLVIEFSRGKAHCTYVLQLKLQCWGQLPWKLCGLSHCDEFIARTIATEVISQYEQAPPNPALHHRVTSRCLSPGCLREELDSFSNGASRADLPLLYHEIAKLRFVPITERSIEEPHSRVKRSIAFRNHGPLSVSMTARCREVEPIISGSLEQFEMLAQCIGEVTSIRPIPFKLDLGLHPWLRSLPRTAQTTKWVSLLSCIIYRCDDLSQFENFQDARPSKLSQLFAGLVGWGEPGQLRILNLEFFES